MNKLKMELRLHSFPVMTIFDTVWDGDPMHPLDLEEALMNIPISDE